MVGLQNQCRNRRPSTWATLRSLSLVALMVLSATLVSLPVSAEPAPDRVIVSLFTISNTTFEANQNLVVADGGILAVDDATVLMGDDAGSPLRIEVQQGGQFFF